MIRRTRSICESGKLIRGLILMLAAGCVACSAQEGNAPLESGFETGAEGYSAYRGSVAITEGRDEVRNGKRALKWTYRIRKQSIAFIARGDLDSRQFSGKSGIRVWLKSDKKGPLLFQLMEKDKSSYQYLNQAQPVGDKWQRFDIPFAAFEKDPDAPDENNRLDVDQIAEFWLIDVSGYYNPELVGPRTVWLDDVEVVGRLDQPKTEVSETEGDRVIASGPFGKINNLKSDPCVRKDGGIYKMWYGANRDGSKQQIFYATSRDGIRWDMRAEPVVKLGKRGSWDAADIETPNVIKVGKLYHLWYSGRAKDEENDTWSPESAYEIGHAVSRDGVKWVKDARNPVLRLGKRTKGDWNWATVGESTVVYSEGKFSMWYVGGNVLNGRVHFHIGYATSDDGSKWVNYPNNPVIASKPSAKDVEYNGYFTPCVVRDGGRYCMLYTKETLNNQPNGPIRFATSTDGINWTMHERALLGKGGATSWNSSGVFGPTAMLDGESLHLWYTGFRITTNFHFGIGYKKLEKKVLQ